MNFCRIDKHFFSRKKRIREKETRTKLINYCYFSINEANLSHIIKQIPFYFHYFSVLEEFEKINISQLRNDIIEKLDFSNENPGKNSEYYLFKYRDHGATDFVDFLYGSTHVKPLIFNIVNSFTHILYSLHLLNENKVCFFNITPEHILYLTENREKPVLSNFQLSLDLNKLEYTYLSHILNKLDNFTYQPFEIHILFYFVKNRMISISYAFVEEFCENYIKNLHILSLFSEKFKQNYAAYCKEMMRKYINLDRKAIIKDIFERNNKWDVYGITVIFIQIFGNFSRVYHLKNNFISKITIELARNIHPDSDKRMTLEETLNHFNRLLNEQNDWSFINTMDNNRLSVFFDELAK